MGGSYGLIGLPFADLFGWQLREPHDWVIPALVGMLLVYGLCHRIGESPTGRVLKGIREDPVSTQALGKNVFGYKVAVFGITSGAGCVRRFDAGRLVAVGDTRRVRFLVLADRVRDRDLRWDGQPRRHRRWAPRWWSCWNRCCAASSRWKPAAPASCS